MRGKSEGKVLPHVTLPIRGPHPKRRTKKLELEYSPYQNSDASVSIKVTQSYGAFPKCWKMHMELR